MSTRKIAQDRMIGIKNWNISISPGYSIPIECHRIQRQIISIKSKTIARIRNSEFTKNKDEINFKELGIDELISTEELATNEIKLLLEKGAFHDTHEFENGALIMVGIIMSKSAPILGLTVKKAAATFTDIHFIPVAIQHYKSQQTIIPRGNTVFEAKDQVYFITTPEGVDEIQKLSGTSSKAIKNVMIAGGSEIGKRTAIELCNKNLNTAD